MLVCSVQLISHLDSQSKFEMYTVFSGRRVGDPRRKTNMAARARKIFASARMVRFLFKFPAV